MISEELKIAFEIINSFTPVFIGIIAWYGRGFIASVKSMEKDINQIKTTIAEQAAHHSGLVDRIESNEDRHEKIESEVSVLGKKVSALEAIRK